MKTFNFDSTTEAYDATQCDEDINTGDLLIIESEKVVGIAYTWPIAATHQAGALHFINHGKTIQDIGKDIGSVTRAGALVNGYHAAQLEGARRLWPVRGLQDRIKSLSEYIDQAINQAEECWTGTTDQQELQRDARIMIQEREVLQKAAHEQAGYPTYDNHGDPLHA